MSQTYKCKSCGHHGNISDMVMKMGGLLCECRTIVFAPYVDPEYFQELERRKKESEKEEDGTTSKTSQ